MTGKLFISIICLVVVFMQPATAKKREVKGKVTAFHKIPLQKVSIVSSNSDQEVLTDEMGRFSFTCDDSEKLTISARGFFSEKVKLKSIAINDSIHVDLRFKKGKKNFEIATGYGHITESQLSYAIEHLESDPDYSSYRTILEAIEGRVSGVSIGRNSINIRGAATINGGPTPALLVVDGTIIDFSIFVNIPPTTVKSINVIKGAAASARYGSRGMGGVIYVTTKSEN